MSDMQHRCQEETGRDAGAAFWRGGCQCGWVGERHFDVAIVAAALARDDYRAHVEAELGAAAYYEADVRCKNCGSEHSQGVPVGIYVASEECHRCGTRMLEPDNDAWHDSWKRSRAGGA